MLSTIDRLSLRHTLPLVMAGLTALVLVLAVLIAHREVRQTARMVAEERLERVADQLADLASVSAARRIELMRQVRSDPLVVAFIRGEAVDEEELAGRLAALRAPSDSGLPVQIWDARRRVIYSDMPVAAARGLRAEAPAAPAPLDSVPAYDGPRGLRAEAPAAPVPLDSVPAYGAFYDAGGETRYYSSAPILAGGRVSGWLVQQRRVGNPQSAAEIERLIGNDSRVLFSYPGDSLWITLAGEPVAAPLRRPPFDTTVAFGGEGGETYLVRAQEIAGTPWTILIEMPQSAVTAGTSLFLQRMTAAGLFLMVLAVGLAWVLSRRLTVPLRQLAEASDAVARGDYTQRVGATPTNELRRVAAAYNAMAEQVSHSHAELQQRLDEARALTAELEVTTRQAERARQSAQAADRAKSEFLATMSHEIRTPINAVLGFCDLLELEGLDESKRADYVARSRRAARKLAALVDDVLDLARIDAGGMRVDAAPASVRDAVDAVLALLEDDIGRRQLVVDTDVDADLLVFADSHRVEQILLNLLSNAVKFTHPGGRIAVRTVVQRRPGAADSVRIDVEDTGIGIEKVQLERIFEPFVQAQGGYTREYGGTGLGLSISRRFARLMKGDLTADSEPGVGSRFSLVLPSAPTSVPASRTGTR